MFYMAGIIIAGFSVYSLSSISGLIRFGLLTALTILCGILVEAIVGPAVLLTLEPVLFRKPRPGREQVQAASA